ncbi:septal ring lytic transglycosylase RlpA family protein [Sideroxydans lithotrophicus]|uniref:Endolytic peptidoglycan transglycosylase RlpA n=1 Tax=Sideroxydans lithotrophicus (strain ES-1) TaxID=580332 RepID=D5CU48_SIDLE|nr:septal ring lytic transglycosylase RlpA family protein [Sideroxydans lithotrophicus]ADE10383.1 rare lipoprotein A [Sideroxydans lithotrophicus ES-1]
MKTRSLLVLLAAFAVTACSTTQKPGDIQGAAPVVDAVSGPSGQSARAPSAAPATSGGGYLPGDGPGTDIPANIASIPDAVPKAEPLHRYANRPYSALGKTYTPMQVPGNYKQRGIASWYGKKFNGQRTSIGEIYDMYGMTAAHPTLPIPSYARVTNIANGKSVVVRINDRGPFLHDRIMDLSYAAAYKLGFINSGSAEVEVESIAVDGNAPVVASVEPPAVNVAPIAATPAAMETTSLPVETAGAGNGKVYLQLGAFKSAEGAASFLAKMRAELGDGSKALTLYRKGGLTRIHLGPYANADEAHKAATSVASTLGFKPFVSMH